MASFETDSVSYLGCVKMLHKKGQGYLSKIDEWVKVLATKPHRHNWNRGRIVGPSWWKKRKSSCKLSSGATHPNPSSRHGYSHLADENTEAQNKENLGFECRTSVLKCLPADWGIAQLVQCLPSTYEVLSSIPRTVRILDPINITCSHNTGRQQQMCQKFKATVSYAGS